jgi:hypothetical protein
VIFIVRGRRGTMLVASLDGRLLSGSSALDQPHPLQARIPVLANDDVVVHGDSERLCDLDDRFGHMDVGLRGHGVAAGVIVQQMRGLAH